MLNYKYQAYISYSRQDEKWAKWIQNALERYQIPLPLSKKVGMNHLRPIFSGVNDLTGGALSKQLDEALLESEFLIVICSPYAAHSMFVNAEVEQFQKNGRADHIIPIIVDGIPYSVHECFPPSLRELQNSRDEIIAIDVNTHGKDRALIKVLAIILGESFDALWKKYRQDIYKNPLKNVFEILSSVFRRKDQTIINRYEPKKNKTQIFISYRREDGQGDARSIEQALISKFDRSVVFFDFTSLQDKKFNLQILDSIYSCNDFILILSPKSMKKCVKKGDWVALEIRTALKYKKHIIPVNIDNGFKEWPRRFPKDLAELREEQQLEFQRGSLFYESFEKLVERLESVPSTEPKKKASGLFSTDFENHLSIIVADAVKTAIAAGALGKIVFYKLRVNRECVLFVDDAEKSSIEPNSLTKISLERGQYLISLRSKDLQTNFFEKKLVLDNDVFDDLSI
ncbi:MAG: toll/interleukin-1 receptor domain-containing protein [Prevotella sp.]|nr:toll/interleukin-1 receptor domain-containing protein [Prevotella sp.]